MDPQHPQNLPLFTSLLNLLQVSRRTPPQCSALRQIITGLTLPQQQKQQLLQYLKLLFSLPSRSDAAPNPSPKLQKSVAYAFFLQKIGKLSQSYSLYQNMIPSAHKQNTVRAQMIIFNKIICAGQKSRAYMHEELPQMSPSTPFLRKLIAYIKLSKEGHVLEEEEDILMQTQKQKAQFNYCLTLCSQERDNEAITMLNKLMKSKDKQVSLKASLKLGQIWQTQSDFQSAISAYKSALLKVDSDRHRLQIKAKIKSLYPVLITPISKKFRSLSYGASTTQSFIPSKIRRNSAKRSHKLYSTNLQIVKDIMLPHKLLQNPNNNRIPLPKKYSLLGLGIRYSIREMGSDSNINFLEGVKYLAKEAYSQAYRYFDRILVPTVQQINTLNSLIKINQKAGRAKEMQQLNKKLQQWAVHNAIEAADELVAQNQLRKAEKLLVKKVGEFTKSAQIHLALGSIYLKMNQVESAIDFFEKSLSLNGNNLEAKKRLAHAYYCSPTRESAFKELLAEIVKKYEEEEGDDVADILLYLFAEIEGAAIQCYEILKKLEQKYPENNEVSFLLGRTCFRLKDFEGAFTYLKKVIDKQPSHSRALLEMGTLYSVFGNNKQASRMFRRCLQINRQDDKAIVRLAKLVQDQERYREAAVLYKKALSITANKTWLYNLGYCHEKLGQFRQALAYYEKVAETDEYDQEIHLRMGEVLMALYKYDKAFQAFEFASQLSGVPPEGIEIKKAMCKIKSHNYKPAIKILEPLTRTAPTSEIYQHLGYCYYMNGEFREAANCFVNWIKISPHYEAYYNLGLIYHKTSDLQRAEKCYKEALSLSTNHPESLYNLGLVYAAQQLKSKAMYYLQQACKLTDNPEWKKVLEEETDWNDLSIACKIKLNEI